MGPRDVLIVARRRSTVRAMAGAAVALGLWAGSARAFAPRPADARGPAAPQERGCPAVVSVPAPETGLRWLAEPDLVPVARLLVARSPLTRPFPGLPHVVLPDTTRIVLVRDLACLETFGIANPGVDWVAGLADGRRDLAAVRVERAAPAIDEVATVLRHELAHLALGRATNGRAPRWLQEGYAQLATGSWDWGTAWRLRWTFLRGSGDQLRRLGLRFPADPEGARMAYQLSYTAVQELWDISGERGFTAFTAALAGGSTTEQAFRSVFGITESAFEERWQARVENRYGLLYTLSRALVAWTFFAGLLVWAGIRRRRVKRERLEALREADRREAAAAGLDVDDDAWPL